MPVELSLGAVKRNYETGATVKVAPLLAVLQWNRKDRIFAVASILSPFGANGLTATILSMQRPIFAHCPHGHSSFFFSWHTYLSYSLHSYLDQKSLLDHRSDTGCAVHRVPNFWSSESSLNHRSLVMGDKQAAYYMYMYM
jgi:hypothetical protein